MNIAFDIFLEHPEFVDETKLDEDVFYKQFLLFVESVLKPLESEIDTEEKERQHSEYYTGTVIEMLGETYPVFVFENYSEPLKAKMKKLIEQADFDTWTQKIENWIASLNN